MSGGDTVSMNGGELNRLLDGFDVFAQGHRELTFEDESDEIPRNSL